MARIPLIKPYEATTSATTVNWVVESTDTTSVLLTIPGTKEIVVVKDMIFLHSTNTLLNYQPVKESWFVIASKSHSVKGFETHQSYLKYVHSMGFANEPKLYAISKVFDYFDRNDRIDWKNLE
jgi:hypothetical protein